MLICIYSFHTCIILSLLYVYLCMFSVTVIFIFYENKFNHSVFIHSCMLTSRGRGMYIKVMSKNAKIQESHSQTSGTKFLMNKEQIPYELGPNPL